MVVGVKDSSNMNKVFTLLNVIVIGFISIVGAFKADIKNWEIKADVSKYLLFRAYPNKNTVFKIRLIYSLT